MLGQKLEGFQDLSFPRWTRLRQLLIRLLGVGLLLMVALSLLLLVVLPLLRAPVRDCLICDYLVGNPI